MEFRDYAAKETSDLASRLTEAARAAAEHAARQVSDEAQKVADGLRAQIEAASVDKAAIAELLEGAQAHGERLQQELRSATERIDAASRQLDEARVTAERLEGARTDLSAARDAQAAARKAAEAELRGAREAVESLRAELASAMQTLDQAATERMASEEAAAAAHSQTQASEAKLTAVTDLLAKGAAKVKTLEQAQQERERRIQALETKLQSGAAAAPKGPTAAVVLEELLAGFQSLATAETIGEVLTTLVEQMAAQFPRVALFRVRKGHLQGEHQIGFDLKTDVSKLVLPLGMDSLPSRAASSGQIERLAGEELKKSRTPFNGTPACALALPIVVAGDTLAIVYADDSGAPPAERGAAAEEMRARYAETVQHYAVALLMRLTNELKALAELQKYAASLLHEMEQMYEADVAAGIGGAELQKRLAGNLDFARSIYGSRTALEGTDAASLIEDELSVLIDARKGSGFAQDLATVAGHSRAQTAAEAS
ncbi:MAG TPA: hypothetical protein VGI12_20980 [Vicinamibacterales bacterium]|jgi:hypothetical protein